ncbi:MAG: 50S ribosomal protein L11 [Thermoplasmata archaeon]|nr:50S ribosomal protein L11 [Thermoplasmata archaeon]
MSEKIEVLVDGGKASAGPPLGPALGPLGLNIGKVVSDINQKTKDFAGMKVPVKIEVDTKSKEYTITIGTPPTSSLLLQELKIEKGPGDNEAGDLISLTVEQAVKVARMKRDSLSGKELADAVKEVIGVAVSLHIKVDGKDPREVQKLISEGQYSEALGS